MEFRDIKESDFAFVAEHTASRGCCAKRPVNLDFLVALEHEGNVLAIGGVLLLNPSTSWAWLDLTTFAEGHMVVVFRTIRDWLDKMAEMHGITRMMAAVEIDFAEANRTVEHLGFHRESVMSRFFDDKDAYMYVKFYGGET